MEIDLFLVIFFVGGWLFGRLFSLLRLPMIMGMVVFGLLLNAFLPWPAPALLTDLGPFLKSFALIVILLRAGLGIRARTLARVGRSALLMSFVPCLFEAGALTVAMQLIYGFNWSAAALCAFMLAAVSPAVVVPSMLELKERNPAGDNRVPTLILAGASVDDVLAITLFSLFLALAGGTSEVPPGRLVAALPLLVIGGIGAGLAVGVFLARGFTRGYRAIRATEKTLLVLMAGLLLVRVGDYLHIAAFLSVVTVGFVLMEKAGHVARELALKLSKIWVFAEIVLFVMIGMALEPRLALEVGLRGIAVITLGLFFRSLGVLVATAFDRGLSCRERLFCVIAYLPKATVQAALGGIPLAAGIAGGETMLALAVLSILLTAPLGLILIRRFGPVLLGSPAADHGNQANQGSTPGP